MEIIAVLLLLHLGSPLFPSPVAPCITRRTNSSSTRAPAACSGSPGGKPHPFPQATTEQPQSRQGLHRDTTDRATHSHHRRLESRDVCSAGMAKGWSTTPASGWPFPKGAVGRGHGEGGDNEALGAGGACFARRRLRSTPAPPRQDNSHANPGNEQDEAELSDSVALLGGCGRPGTGLAHSEMLRKDWTAGLAAPHSTGLRYSPLGSTYCRPR